ncbi:MAG: carbohydrate porin [Sandaracinus sp.]
MSHLASLRLLALLLPLAAASHARAQDAPLETAEGDDASGGSSDTRLPEARLDERAASAEPESQSESSAASSTPSATDQAVRQFLDGFHFGSYGRIIAASDLRGASGHQSRIVSFAPRVDEEDTYAELELRREDRVLGVDTRIVATVAYAGPLFHYDGEFAERIAIRNLFAEANNILTPGLSIWGGSRMVRGDDLYLMNFWPLDNLNMVGGGLRYALEDDLELAVQVGMSEPNNPFQRQTDLVPARTGFLPDEIFVLDRPRTVLSGRLTYWPLGRMERDGLKGVLYGEQHWLGAGQRTRTDGTTETLPEDSGFVLGGQVGGYLSDSHTFANLFFRYARGLGAYDPLGVPFRTGTVITTGRAEQIRLALAANWEWNESPDVAIGVQLGAWWQLFHDADPAVWNRGALSEGAISIRPHIWFGQQAGVALDLSYQGMQSLALDELTGNGEGGSIFKLAIMPFISPWGRGTYTRPHIRLLYVVSGRDAGARRLLNPADPRASRDVEHFLGVSVEWWFSSSSYAP